VAALKVSKCRTWARRLPLGMGAAATSQPPCHGSGIEVGGLAAHKGNVERWSEIPRRCGPWRARHFCFGKRGGKSALSWAASGKNRSVEKIGVFSIPSAYETDGAASISLVQPIGHATTGSQDDAATRRSVVHAERIRFRRRRLAVPAIVRRLKTCLLCARL
jgi:hypothetical protein